MMVIMMRIIKIKIKDVMKRDNKYECEYNDNNEDENKYIRDNNEDENIRDNNEDENRVYKR